MNCSPIDPIIQHSICMKAKAELLQGMCILTISTSAPGLRPPACADPTGGGGCVAPSGTQLGVLYLGLYLTALGTGGLKSSVSGFGSDQFDESDPGERRRMARFFSWFFFFISIGSLLAVTVLVYVQDHLGRRWGYGACVAAILLGLLVFVGGTTRYRFKKLVGSPLTQIAAVTAAAWRKRALPLPPDPAQLYDLDDAAAAGEDVKGKHKMPRTKQCRFLERAAIVGPSPSSSPPPCTLTDVEEVKQVLRMLPTWATTIPFWTVYAQMTTFSVSQAQAMDRRLGASFHIPAGSLTVFFVGSILLTVPVYDRLLVPLARRITANPQGLSPLQRISVGLLLAVLAMVAAALTERHRRDASLAGDTPSVFLLVPQFLLVGAGEAFTYVGQLDFFLRECPRGMKTMSTGLFLSTLSLGFFFSTAIVSVVHAATTSPGRRPWLTDDLDQGSLHSFYWLLAAISAANLVAFVAVARGYVYKEKRLADAGIQQLAEDDVLVHA
ncbi:Protein NRT1/ PTR FAMILY 6.3 [Dichanthelium oligosanthes]|uniref:Protein NRT1/ PTR FAMILY 6.3 n=1 Tax=Dichanthelium oligosanthes TaxID=888268 RepID=A0A1E5UNW6_9POAL|nr:Protein NRT1/ PTR FAMILY 6.3 [Dichanthelium oligosanthes]